MQPKVIHITGGSGCGVTTLGAAIARQHGYTQLDSDSFYWLPTDPPFRQARPREERCHLLGKAIDNVLAEKRKCVVSGSVMDWGNCFIPHFELVVFLSLPHEVRMARVRKRESERYGTRILPGGDMYESSRAFVAWAAGYDNGSVNGRTRQGHEAWLAKLTCPVVRIEQALTVEKMLALLPLG